MSAASHKIVQDFFAAMSTGDLSDSLFTEDMTAWTTSSGVDNTRDRYIGGVKMLQSFFPERLIYTIDAITAEDDRAVAEVQAKGILANGEEFRNTYVFTFRLRDGKISKLAEHFNPDPMREKVMPLIQAFMAKQAQQG